MSKTAVCRDCEIVFELPIQRGRPAVRCVPCRTKTPSVMQFAKVNTEGIKENVELKQEVVEGVTWRENAEPCTSCSKTFMRPVKRGRPPTKCPDCLAWDDIEKAAAVTTSQETLEELFSGDKELLNGTPDALPKGAEAQCPPPTVVDESLQAIQQPKITKCMELTGTLPVARTQHPLGWNHENDGKFLSGLDRLQRKLSVRAISSSAVVTGVAGIIAALARS